MEKKKYTEFPKVETATPLELYSAVFPTIPQPRNEAYFSSPLTSGGAKRLYTDNEAFADVGPTIVRLNSNFAQTVAHESEDAIASGLFTLPHDLGKRQDWKELDYNRFWMYYISGIDSRVAAQYDRSDKGIAADVFNNYDLSREQRIQEFDRLVDGFVDFIGETETPTNPVDRIICLPDYRMSVGCSAEARLGIALGIPTHEVLFNRAHPRFQEQIAPAAPWLVSDGNIEGDGAFGNEFIVFQALKTRTIN